MTFKVNDKLRQRMRKFAHVNWSEVARSAIEERLRLEENLEKQSLNLETLERAIAVQDSVRAKSSGQWSLSKEIRRWREPRR